MKKNILLLFVLILICGIKVKAQKTSRLNFSVGRLFMEQGLDGVSFIDNLSLTAQFEKDFSKDFFFFSGLTIGNANKETRTDYSLQLVNGETVILTEYLGSRFQGASVVFLGFGLRLIETTKFASTFGISGGFSRFSTIYYRRVRQQLALDDDGNILSARVDHVPEQLITTSFAAGPSLRLLYGKGPWKTGIQIHRQLTRAEGVPSITNLSISLVRSL